jgi:hypothetical protein
MNDSSSQPAAAGETQQGGIPRRVGLIAGGGQFPLLFSKTARRRGLSLFTVAHRKESDPALADYADAIEWVHLGQVGRMLKFFKRHRVADAVMMGTIQKTRMFSDVRPDTRAIALFAAMADNTHDDRVLSAFAALLEKEGIRVRPSTFLLPEMLAPAGCWTRRRPGKGEMNDVRFGWAVAKEIGRLDIGQCVVVAGGSVTAVEAIDGTDATILRGGRLAKGTAVAVKVCKPTQDMRFDVPAVGAQTIRSMQEAGVRALAVEAGKAVVFDRREMIELANRFKIAVVALKDPEDSPAAGRAGAVKKNRYR